MQFPIVTLPAYFRGFITPGDGDNVSKSINIFLKIAALLAAPIVVSLVSFHYSYYIDQRDQRRLEEGLELILPLSDQVTNNEKDSTRHNYLWTCTSGVSCAVLTKFGVSHDIPSEKYFFVCHVVHDQSTEYI